MAPAITRTPAKKLIREPMPFRQEAIKHFRHLSRQWLRENDDPLMRGWDGHSPRGRPVMPRLVKEDIVPLMMGEENPTFPQRGQELDRIPGVRKAEFSRGNDIMAPFPQHWG